MVCAYSKQTEFLHVSATGVRIQGLHRVELIVKELTMPVTYHWYQERNDAVYITIAHPWTIQEISDCEQTVRRLIAERKIIVDAIYDVTRHGPVARNTLSYFIRSMGQNQKSPYEGVAIVYGASLYAKAIADAIIRITRTKSIRFAQSLEEADQILADIRSERHGSN